MEHVKEFVMLSAKDMKRLRRQQQNQKMKSASVSGSVQDNYQDYVLKAVVNSLYSVYGARVTTLISYLRGAPLSWNGKGEIIINNSHLILGSSLVALLDDVLHYGPSNHPKGYLEFSQVLKHLGVPDHIIGETTGIYKPTFSAQNWSQPLVILVAEKKKKQKKEKHSDKWKKKRCHCKKFDHWL
jgi:hypothetical protein